MDDDKLPAPVEVTKDLREEVMKLIDNPPPIDPEIERIISTCFSCNRDKRDAAVEPCRYCKPRPLYPDDAPDGQIFVCAACGKLAKSIYGDDKHGLGGWDESCMLNAVLCYEDRKDEKGLWVAVEGY
ncbi:MAG: hypothetical protein AB7L09_03285 [Nitrospira sp.]